MEHWRRQFSVSSNVTAKATSLWREFMNEVYYPIEISNFRINDFEGNLEEIKLGDLQITKFVADEQQVERTKFHTKFDSSEDFIFIIPQRGALSYRQFGRQGQSPQYSSTLLLCSEPYWAACSGDYANVTIRIPASRIRERVKGIESLCGRTLARDNFLNGALSGMVGGFFENSTSLVGPDKALAARCADTVVDMVVLTLEREQGQFETSGGTRAMVYRRVLDFLRENLVDPDLSPLVAAQANGISVSYMNKIFRAAGQSVAKVIQDERLALAHETLVRQSTRCLSIGQIAFDAGFNNQAHFTSCFRAKYGATPREVRRSALEAFDRSRKLANW